jgi:predicted nucleic acid-binding Zn ribbon protein
MPIPNRRGPRALSDILGDLFAARGYGRLLAHRELQAAWDEAVGEPARRQTRLGEVRRGVLNVNVSHPALLEELAAFRKAELLAALRSGAPGTTIHDIRFKIGATDPGPEPVGAGDPEADDAGATAGARARRGRGRGRGPSRSS